MAVVDSQPIGYAPPERSLRHRLRRWLFPALVVAGILSAYWWAPPTLYRARVLYWQAKCVRYSAPPNSVVASERSWSSEIDAAGQSYAKGLSTQVVPTEWTRLYNLLSPPGLVSGGTVFLHRRCRPGGQSVLVAIDLIPSTTADFGAFSYLQVRTLAVGTGTRLPVQLSDDRTPVFGLVQRVKGYRFYAGQPDPVDPTHFTLTYEVGGAKATIDGWVREQRVELEWRTATTRPLPMSEGQSR